jgi:hypothetical protein
MLSLTKKNWLTEMWERFAYRMGRESLTFGSNYMVLQPPLPANANSDQLTRAAFFVWRHALLQ